MNGIVNLFFFVEEFSLFLTLKKNKSQKVLLMSLINYIAL